MDGIYELDISFSAVAASFQVTLRCDGKDVMTVSSENVRLVELRHDQYGSGIHVVFDTHDATSTADVSLEPELHCHWRTLRS